MKVWSLNSKQADFQIWRFLKGYFTQKWKFDHHLLTFMLFRHVWLSFFYRIPKNVRVQTTFIVYGNICSLYICASKYISAELKFTDTYKSLQFPVKINSDNFRSFLDNVWFAFHIKPNFRTITWEYHVMNSKQFIMRRHLNTDTFER